MMDALGSFEPGFPTHLQSLGDEVDGCTSEEDGREEDNDENHGLSQRREDMVSHRSDHYSTLMTF